MQALVLAVAVYVLLPRVAGLRETTDTLVRLRWWLPGVAIALEAGSLACYAELIRTVLATEGASPPRRVVQQAVLAGRALGKVLPGGTLAALPGQVRVLRRGAVDPAVAAAAGLASGVLSSLLLVALLPLAAAVGLLSRQSGAVALGVAGIAIGTAVLVVLAWIGVRDPDLGRRLGTLVRRLGRGHWLRARLHTDEMATGVERAAAALRVAAQDRRGMARAAGFAAGSWLLDFTVIAVIALAATRGSPLAGLPLAYVVGQLAATVPITPGGVGVVETTMTAALVAQGSPAGQAAAVVLTWRLVSHWLPIVTGLVAYLANAVAGPGRHPRRRAD
ncbi:MAG TPA: lysylphosphatidylglycerol synthase transmembrane domain-containing protein [Acidimicrobiales bacterium]|nr:lysylphosphatidylglycerol synthase transmembrane domain-containing protein [Acidimicrobiales bacterium]